MSPEIPNGWQDAQLSDLAVHVTDKWEPGDGQFPYIGLEHLDQGTGTILEVGTSEGLTSLKTRFVKDDVLFGKLRPNLRKTALVDFDGIASTDIVALRAKRGVDPKFLFYTVSSEPCFEHAIRSAAGTKMPRTSWSQMGEYRVLLPPLTEQRRIAEILSSVDEAIQATQVVIEQTRSVKQSVLKRLLAKGIGHTKFKQIEIGEIPEGWTVHRLEEVCTLSGGAGFPEKYQGHQDLNYPFVKVSDMNLPGNEKFMRRWNNTIDDAIAKAIRARPFPKGAIIFPKVGAALLTNKRRILQQPTFVDNNIMVAIPNIGISTEYLYHYLCEVDFAKHVQSGAVPSVNQAMVGNLIVPVPPEAEQQAIADILAAMDQTIEQLSLETTQYQSLKIALMSDLLTGRKRLTTDLLMAAE